MIAVLDRVAVTANLPRCPNSVSSHGRGHRLSAQTDLCSAQTSVNSPGFHDRDLGQFDAANAVIGFRRGLEVGLRGE
jgi:hypothetical protein